MLLTGSTKEDTSWLGKISQENPVYHKQRIFESKGPFFYESFRWILDNPDFNKWRNTEKSGVFWIKGDPGKGKTMLLGGLVDNLEQSPQMGINLAYFFCQATDPRINTSAAVIGGLVVSFIKQHHELRSYIRMEYKDDLEKLNGPDRWYILRDMFEKVAKHSTVPNPVCVVDALDECEQEQGCKQLLRLIIETSCHVKWLISSRNIPGIERELQAIVSSRRLSLELKENAEYVTKSVDLYIDNSIQTIVALKDDEKLLAKATNVLKSKASGTFLWVALVIEQLRDTKHRNVEAVLGGMPMGLENLYNLILQQLAKREDKDAYRILLSTVTAAERPLRLEELLTFINSQWTVNETTTTTSLRDMQDILKDCGSFISIRNDTVYFVHQSVKDYMMGTTARGIIFPSGIEYQHYTMFMSSLNAMLLVLKHDIYGLKDPGSDTDTISPPDPDPLAPIAYCCIFWVDHLLRSCESGASRDKLFLKDGKALHSFLKLKYLCWLEALALLRCLTPQGADAVQKLKNLFSGYYSSDINRRRVAEMANLREDRKSNRSRSFIYKAYQFLRRYKQLSLTTCIDYAYMIFYHHDDSHLRAFIDDAYQFFQYCQYSVRQYPLQLYHSALIFEDTHSAIYTTFQPIIRAEFKNKLALKKMPQRRFSLVQNIELDCRGHIIAIIYSPDSSYLCALSTGGSISLCRTDTYSVERVIELDPDKEYESGFLSRCKNHFICFSVNSKRLISISRGGIVQVWSVPCGTQMRKLALGLGTDLVLDHEPFGFGYAMVPEQVIALSHHGDIAASACQTLSGAVSLVKVWTLEAGECIHVIDQSHMQAFFHAAFSPNLATMALFDGKDARIYSIQTGKEVKRIRHPEDVFKLDVTMKNFRYSSDSKLLALKYADRDTSFWCTETWEMVRHIKSKLSTGYFDLSSNAAMSVGLSQSGALFIESMDTGEPILNIKPHTQVNDPIFSPNWADSSLLASFSDGAVQIWRAYSNTSNNLKSSEAQNTASYIRHLTIPPNSKFVTTCDDRGNAEIWNGESGERVQVLEREAFTWSLPAFSPNLEFVLGIHGETGDISIWHVDTGRLFHLLKGAGNYVMDMAFSDDSRYVVAGYWPGLVKVWCVESGKCLFERDQFDDYTTNISDVAFSPGSRYIGLLSRGYCEGSKAAYIWDWRIAHRISRIELGHETFIRSLAFSSDTTTLVIIASRMYLSSPDSYKVSFYDITSGTRLHHMEIGESNSVPLFDSANDNIVSDRLRYCKKSSWKHWDTIPQPGYTYLEAGPDSIAPYTAQENWICFGDKKAVQVPRHLLCDSSIHVSKSIQVSNSLLAFKSTAGELYIVELPKQYGI